MKFNYIKYHNYRCFEDVTVRFDTSNEQNISLVLGVNGTGKTEMLFSFQWVLYGFDFGMLREKDETPYALNSTLYHKLEVDPHANSIDCFVELSFTNKVPNSEKSRDYFVKRTATFMRANNIVKSIERIEYSYSKDNGERSEPIRDSENVEKILSRIIPKSILEGITFDGERMRKLNIAGEQSKDTIKNVISLVNNERLFKLCADELKELKGDIRKERIRLNKSSGNVSAEELENEITELESTIDDRNIELNGIKINQEKIDSSLEEISLKLTQYDDAKKLEQRRKGLEKDFALAKRHYEQNTEQFFKRLVDGYALVMDQLVHDVKSSIENVDVPAGLTVEAVRSILKRPTCICGCEMNDAVVQRLRDMIATLPPDNISSTLLYMANQFEGEKKRARELLLDSFQAMTANENEVSEIKKDLAEISALLTAIDSETIKQLENERNELLLRKGSLNDNEERCTQALNKALKRLKDAKKELEEVSSSQGRILELDKQFNLVELYLKAIDKIKERYIELSLESINSYLTRAYKMLSDDIGRRIYLCQFNKEKYTLVTYVMSKYEQLRTSWINNGYIRTLESEGKSENEIHEIIVLKVLEGKSTGQSKVNSLAFAKAILDYSNKNETSDNLRISHDYPFLIDSPFTELSGKNLENVAQHIHTFANQIILMADDKSYSGVQSLVKPAVKSITRLLKDTIAGLTYTE